MEKTKAMPMLYVWNGYLVIKKRVLQVKIAWFTKCPAKNRAAFTVN